MKMMKKSGPLTIKDKIILATGLFSLVLLTVSVVIAERNPAFMPAGIENQAYDHMKRCIETISESHSLIGPELSELTTTLGDRAAKQTTLNPAFASLIVRLLSDAGVRKGDAIAVGCSGSFPGLLIAVLSASAAMELEPGIILSLGASSFGASDPDFTILDMHMLLHEKGLTQHLPLAVSPGGDLDIGREMEPETVSRLVESVPQYGIPLIFEGNLVRNRAIRDSIYFSGSDDGITAFINSGGGYANMGTSSLSLLLKPGIVRKAKMPPPESRGVIHDMLERRVPVIHLLYIKGIATRYRIPWDE
jgi:poly-gamma-glutamate system protein